MNIGCPSSYESFHFTPFFAPCPPKRLTSRVGGMFITDDAKQSCEGKRIPLFLVFDSNQWSKGDTSDTYKLWYPPPAIPIPSTDLNVVSWFNHGYDCPMNQFSILLFLLSQLASPHILLFGFFALNLLFFRNIKTWVWLFYFLVTCPWLEIMSLAFKLEKSLDILFKIYI